MENDFDVSVFIITSDNQYIPVNEYEKEGDCEGVFIMLTNEELDKEYGSDNSIYLYKDLGLLSKDLKSEFRYQTAFKDSDYYVSCKWQTVNEEIPGTFKLNEHTDDLGGYQPMRLNECVRKYLNGHETTMEIIRNVRSLLEETCIEEYIPAVMMAYHAKVQFDSRTIHGYLPTIGQLVYISKNIPWVDFALRKIGHTFNSKHSTYYLIDYYWSSTECNFEYTWYSYNGYVENSKYKDMFARVLPLFLP